GETTTPTVDDVNSGVFKFEWATNVGGLTIEFRNVGDTSGQIGPYAHAEMFVSRKPHLLIIVLDLSSRGETDRLHGSFDRWFEAFCAYVVDRLMARPRLNRRVSSRLRNIIVLLNKADTLEPTTSVAALGDARDRIRQILRDHLGRYFRHEVLANCPIL